MPNPNYNDICGNQEACLPISNYQLGNKVSSWPSFSNSWYIDKDDQDVKSNLVNLPLAGFSESLINLQGTLVTALLDLRSASVNNWLKELQVYGDLRYNLNDNLDSDFNSEIEHSICIPLEKNIVFRLKGVVTSVHSSDQFLNLSNEEINILLDEN